MRVSYSGSTGVSKTSSGGSIPSTRANLKQAKKPFLNLCEEGIEQRGGRGKGFPYIRRRVIREPEGS